VWFRGVTMTAWVENDGRRRWRGSGNGGVSDGTHVISSAWVDASIREHVSIPGRSIDGDGYGYEWFTRTYESNGAPVAAALRTVWGGQVVIVVPDHETPVVLTGGDYVPQRRLTHLITDYLVPAIAQTA
jgi:CubicO group peptidase (beta-lactamase class C family)